LIDEVPGVYDDFVAEDGTIYLKLLKALYGTIQAAMLFFKNIS
jgi:hypothetical protein